MYRETPNDLTISINEIDLESILTNLFTNSIKSLQKIDKERKIKMEAMFDEGKFILKFSDNGIGIQPEHKERVFEPLFSTYLSKDGKTKGTGLGLPIVKEILARYEGKISMVRSEFSSGITFLIEIPLSNAPMVLV